MTALLALAVLGAPDHLVGYFTGMPGLASSGGLSISLQSHSATVQLYHGSVMTQTLTVFKNNTAKSATITLAIPNHVRRAETMGVAHGPDIDATWDKASINIANNTWTTHATTNAQVTADGYFSVKVKVNANATHALRLSWQGDLMTSGVDGKTRTLGYDVSRAKDWASVGQFKYSIQYRESDSPEATAPKGSPVFAVDSTVPSTGWQIGPKGAFLGGLPSTSTIYFQFHPNTFGGRLQP